MSGDVSATVGSTRAAVDPRAPRFGQSLTALGTGAFVVTGHPAPLYAVAAVLVVAVLSRWRVDVYGTLWKRAVVPVVGRPAETEPAAPHRFAKLLGATFTATATGLALAGYTLPATVVAGAVAVLAAVAAVFDVCVGCRMYRQVSVLHRLDVV